MAVTGSRFPFTASHVIVGEMAQQTESYRDR
jgi:hypothetical protein